MSGKRALAQDEPAASGKASRDGMDKKRRKLLHDDAAHSPPSPNKQTQAQGKQSSKRRKSKPQGSDSTPSKSADATEQPTLALSNAEEAPDEQGQEQEQQSVIPAKSPQNWSISRCAGGGRFLNLDPVFAGDGR